ncbi:hypothetical protein BJ912DRAFT_1043628 [Pholiota molesta]|nr:hypothetical protein BJ912DRAFT_1043628 [Pholiota molesta]
MYSFAKMIPLIVFLATFASNVNAVGCFSGGQVGDCSSAIDGFCNNGHTIAGNKVLTSCVNVNNYHCNFKIENTSGTSMSISKAVCQADLLVTNNGCDGHGGIRQDGNFLLTIDPNAGSC